MAQTFNLLCFLVMSVLPRDCKQHYILFGILRVLHLVFGFGVVVFFRIFVLQLNMGCVKIATTRARQPKHMNIPDQKGCLTPL